MKSTNGRRLCGTIVALVCCAAVTACATAATEAAVGDAAAVSHRDYSRGSYRDTYVAGDPEFISDVQLENWLSLLKKTKSQLGDVRSSTKRSYVYSASPQRGLVAATVYQTVFENGEAEERFLWRVDDRSPKLLSYSITSPQLK